MKKIVFILSFLCGHASILSQEITPYYPAKESREAWLGYEPSQLTYYDEMYVQGAINNFIDMNLDMTNVDVTANHKKKEYTSIFQDKLSMGHAGKLYVTYRYDTIDVDMADPAIIKSIIIKGDADRVISFFVQFWKTDYHTVYLKKNITRRHLQDIITLYFNKGKPYIEIKNTMFKSAKEFETYFKEKLAKSK